MHVILTVRIHLKIEIKAAFLLKRIKQSNDDNPLKKNFNPAIKTSHNIIIIQIHARKSKERNEKFAFHLITFAAFVYSLYDICEQVPFSSKFSLVFSIIILFSFHCI